MNVGILGAGNIGGTLGRRLSEAGHDVMFGVRDVEKAREKLPAGLDARFGSPAEAVAFGEAVILAVPLGAARELLAGLGDFSGRVLIDATNAFAGAPEGFGSASEAIVEWARGARVVKAFNAQPWESLDNPVYSGLTVEAFVCGDDADAKATVLKLAADMDLNAIDAGSLANAPLTENFARFWGALAYQAGLGRDFAFKIVRR